MKHFLIIFCIIIFCSSCKKEKTPAVTKTDLLCGKIFKKWKVSGYQCSANSPVTAATADLLGKLPSTYRDNFMIFYPNGVEKLNEGATGSKPSQDYITGSWSFNSDETKINCTMLFGLLGTADESLNSGITELSDQKMVIDHVVTIITNTYYCRWTLVPIN